MRRKHGGLGAAIAGAAVLLVSCSVSCSVLYSPTSGEFAGGGDGDRDGGPSADAATSGDAAATDATDVDANGGDGLDGNVAVDGGPLVCPPLALLCEGFESADLVTTTIREEQQGLVSTSDREARSGKRSLAALLRKGQPSPMVATTLAAKNKARLSFWFQAKTTVPNPDVNFRIADFLWGEACSWELSWTLSLTGVGLRMGLAAFHQPTNPNCGPTSYDDHVLMGPNQVFGTGWHHLVADFDASTQRRHVSVSVDGAPAVPLEILSVQTTVPDEARVSFGVPCTQTSEGCFEWSGAEYEVFFDDVIVSGP